MKDSCEEESPETEVSPLSDTAFARTTAITFSCGLRAGHTGRHMASFTWTDKGWTGPIVLNGEVVAYE